MSVSQGLRFPDWAVVDDDGHDVLLVDASREGGDPVVVHDRATFFALLDKLRAGTQAAPLASDERALLARLRADGRLVDDASPAPDWATGDDEGSPHLGNFVLELEVDEHGACALDAARGVLARLLHSGRHVPGLVLRLLPRGAAPDGTRLARVLSALTGVLQDVRAAVPERGLAFGVEIPMSPLAVDVAAEAILEDAGRCRAVLRPLDADGMPGEDELAAGRRLAEAGFECILELEPSGARDLRPAAAAWLATGGCSAVRIAPKPAVDLDATTLAAHLARVRVLALDLADRLEGSLQRSQPWRSILASALLAWPGTSGWSKLQSRVFVSADGRLARSERHAARGVHESLASLLPEPDAWAARDDRDSRHDAGARLAGVPDCAACGYAALCDKFGSLEFDVARREGHTERAVALAGYECDVRQDALGRLLDSLRREAGLREPRAAVRVHFHKSEGTVELGPR